MNINDTHRSGGVIIEKGSGDHFYNAAAWSRWAVRAAKWTDTLVGKYVWNGWGPCHILEVFFGGPDLAPVIRIQTPSDGIHYAKYYGDALWEEQNGNFIRS